METTRDPRLSRPSSRPVTVLVVDDQKVFREAARELISAAEGFQQVAEAASGEEALEKAARLHPDMVLIDVRMPGMDGPETARRLRMELPDALLALVSLGGSWYPPSGPGVEAPPHVRKQDLSIAKLRELWEAYQCGRSAAEGRPGQG